MANASIVSGAGDSGTRRKRMKQQNDSDKSVPDESFGKKVDDEDSDYSEKKKRGKNRKAGKEVKRSGKKKKKRRADSDLSEEDPDEDESALEIPQPKIMMPVAAKRRKSQNPSAATTEASTPAAANDDEDEDGTRRRGNSRTSGDSVKKVVDEKYDFEDDDDRKSKSKGGSSKKSGGANLRVTHDSGAENVSETASDDLTASSENESDQPDAKFRAEISWKNIGEHRWRCGSCRQVWSENNKTNHETRCVSHETDKLMWELEHALRGENSGYLRCNYTPCLQPVSEGGIKQHKHQFHSKTRAGMPLKQGSGRRKVGRPNRRLFIPTNIVPLELAKKMDKAGWIKITTPEGVSYHANVQIESDFWKKISKFDKSVHANKIVGLAQKSDRRAKTKEKKNKKMDAVQDDEDDMPLISWRNAVSMRASSGRVFPSTSNRGKNLKLASTVSTTTTATSSNLDSSSVGKATIEQNSDLDNDFGLDGKMSAPFEPEKVDTSKAPGYRGSQSKTEPDKMRSLVPPMGLASLSGFRCNKSSTHDLSERAERANSRYSSEASSLLLSSVLASPAKQGMASGVTNISLPSSRQSLADHRNTVAIIKKPTAYGLFIKDHRPSRSESGTQWQLAVSRSWRRLSPSIKREYEERAMQVPTVKQCEDAEAQSNPVEEHLAFAHEEKVAQVTQKGAIAVIRPYEPALCAVAAASIVQSSSIECAEWEDEPEFEPAADAIEDHNDVSWGSCADEADNNSTPRPADDVDREGLVQQRLAAPKEESACDLSEQIRKKKKSNVVDDNENETNDSLYTSEATAEQNVSDACDSDACDSDADMCLRSASVEYDAVNTEDLMHCQTSLSAAIESFNDVADKDLEATVGMLKGIEKQVRGLLKLGNTIAATTQEETIKKDVAFMKQSLADIAGGAHTQANKLSDRILILARPYVDIQSGEATEIAPVTEDKAVTDNDEAVTDATASSLEQIPEVGDDDDFPDPMAMAEESTVSAAPAPVPVPVPLTAPEVVASPSLTKFPTMYVPEREGEGSSTGLCAIRNEDEPAIVEADGGLCGVEDGIPLHQERDPPLERALVLATDEQYSQADDDFPEDALSASVPVAAKSASAVPSSSIASVECVECEDEPEFEPSADVVAASTVPSSSVDCEDEPEFQPAADAIEDHNDEPEFEPAADEADNNSAPQPAPFTPLPVTAKSHAAPKAVNSAVDSELKRSRAASEAMRIQLEKELYFKPISSHPTKKSVAHKKTPSKKTHANVKRNSHLTDEQAAGTHVDLGSMIAHIRNTFALQPIAPEKLNEELNARRERERTEMKRREKEEKSRRAKESELARELEARRKNDLERWRSDLNTCFLRRISIDHVDPLATSFDAELEPFGRRLTRENVGFRVLEKIGWKLGDRIGKRENGRAFPIASSDPREAGDLRGLGYAGRPGYAGGPRHDTNKPQARRIMTACERADIDLWTEQAKKKNILPGVLLQELEEKGRAFPTSSGKRHHSMDDKDEERLRRIEEACLVALKDRISSEFPSFYDVIPVKCLEEMARKMPCSVAKLEELDSFNENVAFLGWRLIKICCEFYDQTQAYLASEDTDTLQKALSKFVNTPTQ